MISITPSSLTDYINSLKALDGTVTKTDLNSIILYIIQGGLPSVINTKKSNNGGIF